MSRQRILLFFLLATALAFIAGVVAYERVQSNKLARLASEPNSVFNRAHSPKYGSPTAKVRIVEFFDPACETCRDFYPLVKDVVDRSAGKVQLVVRYAPFHHGSDTAVKILEAARLQGLFWPVAEAMLRYQPAWASHDAPRPDLIWGYLSATGLNARAAQDEMNTPSVLRSIEQDLADAKELNVTRTPGFFVNGRPLKDFGYTQLKALVEEEVRAAYGSPGKAS